MARPASTCLVPLPRVQQHQQPPPRLHPPTHPPTQPHAHSTPPPRRCIRGPGRVGRDRGPPAHHQPQHKRRREPRGAPPARSGGTQPPCGGGHPHGPPAAPARSACCPARCAASSACLCCRTPSSAGGRHRRALWQDLAPAAARRALPSGRIPAGLLGRWAALARAGACRAGPGCGQQMPDRTSGCLAVATPREAPCQRLRSCWLTPQPLRRPQAAPRSVRACRPSPSTGRPWARPTPARSCW
jgi:hypothetical protein